MDHVLVRVLDLDRVRFPPGPADHGSPFVRYRGLLHSQHRARAAGVPDDEYVALAARLDEAVSRVAGRGFLSTPFGRSTVLSDRLGFSAAGGVWVKDETGNVAGSHKARHLMGVLLHLEVSERAGLTDPARRPDLAIASCGNAALAAAVLARAADRRLRVFVPRHADHHVLESLRELGADVVTCTHTDGTPGDPTYARLRAAIAAGAVPFTCQGPENGLVIEGGETMAYEIATSLREEGVGLDHLVVQVGGGALASACLQGLAEAADLGVLERVPCTHTVQTTGGHPLERAYRLVRALLPATPTGEEAEAALREAAQHRSAYMWPWETEPRSIATGILDDETYDWRATVAGMLATGGRPLVVSEQLLAQAHDLGHAAGHAVCPTGSAGLAGLLTLVADGTVGPDDRVAVLFTGVDR
ncbi:MAG TPA: pyridoxal-phosphate dependent enzyme [Nocardioides sp.]|uniref:pyridoxal-phosphate dependent enzyme n=1 Tax=Nocardioides sp. TaxID=35761 RepID=UPI002C15101B|nr:pyridoxal-phosphate dependent enzyme [Nocardioides sp.]HQR27990.1 pyridoxal-phosphate dependent enzyme [Nocardioides sp.]